MSYQVLARKWRPATFHQMVGQEHVLQALVNALDNNRLHHAYLFTGTRGVGKTSIARLFAKALNCEKGITSTPCGECSPCREISEGRFVDLIEVDAASRTKVEDTRELLENVQYAPSQGRYKVYLIDEVHMLSTSSFNALLKTLEEPPPHIKFLLATTDPQKLPVTILSRCLQFNLKNMVPERIVEHLQMVLSAEQFSFEEPALWLLARAANGSMRDAMSLTDQAIAFCDGALREADVRAMLGTVDARQVLTLLQQVGAGSAAGVLRAVADLAEFGADFDGVLAELMTLLHRVTLAQMVPEAVDNSQGDRDAITALAAQLRAEDAQLFYQIALNGRRDLPHVPDYREGLEMTLLRMIAFRPVRPGEVALPQGSPQPAPLVAAAPAASTDAPVAPNGPSAEVVPAPTASAASQPTPQEPSSVAMDETAGDDDFSAYASMAPWETPPTAGDGPKKSEPAPAGTVPFDTAATLAPPAPGADEAREATTAGPELVPERVAPTVVPPTVVPPPAAAVVSPQEELPQVIAAAAPSAVESASAPAAVTIPVSVTSAAVGAEARIPLAALQAEDWVRLLEQIGLAGMTYNIAANAALEAVEGNHLAFSLGVKQFHLFNDTHRERMQTALSEYFSAPVTLSAVEAESQRETPAQYRERKRRERQAEAVAAIQQDHNVQAIIARFDASLDLNSVRPIDVAME
ncbi:MAG TPA: DNA polymerase III subunit gamma/tau [Motiliproteus sp.]